MTLNWLCTIGYNHCHGQIRNAPDFHHLCMRALARDCMTCNKILPRLTAPHDLNQIPIVVINCFSIFSSRLTLRFDLFSMYICTFAFKLHSIKKQNYAFKLFCKIKNCCIILSNEFYPRTL